MRTQPGGIHQVANGALPSSTLRDLWGPQCISYSISLLPHPEAVAFLLSACKSLHRAALTTTCRRSGLCKFPEGRVPLCLISSYTPAPSTRVNEHRLRASERRNGDGGKIGFRKLPLKHCGGAETQVEGRGRWPQPQAVASKALGN